MSGINVSISITKDNTAEFAASLKKLANSQVLVGIPEANATRDSDGTVAKTPINNAALLYIHDKGAPEAGIPARPVVGPGIEDKKPQITKEMMNAGRMILRGANPTDSLARVGTVAVAGIKQRIRSNTPPELAASTLAARRRRGITRTNTLVDTGKMLNAVTYIVTPKRGA